MEALNEQQYPLVKLVLEQALEPELVRTQTQVAAQVRVQALVRVQLKLERHLQQSCPKLQLHRHRCKVPDRSREPQ